MPDDLPGFEAIEKAAGPEAIGSRIVITSLRGGRRSPSRDLWVRDCVDPAATYGVAGSMAT